MQKKLNSWCLTIRLQSFYINHSNFLKTVYEQRTLWWEISVSPPPACASFSVGSSNSSSAKSKFSMDPWMLDLRELARLRIICYFMVWIWREIEKKERNLFANVKIIKSTCKWRYFSPKRLAWIPSILCRTPGTAAYNSLKNYLSEIYLASSQNSTINNFKNLTLTMVQRSMIEDNSLSVKNLNEANYNRKRLLLLLTS